jgi:hypothetical protein
MLCKKCISIHVSARVQKLYMNDVTMKKHVMTNKTIVKYFRIFANVYYGNFSLIVYNK